MRQTAVAHNLKKNNYIALNFLILISIFGCKQSAEKIAIENYNINATVLITQILSEDINCDCIIEPRTNTSLLKTKADEMPEYDFKKDLFSALKIDNEKILDSLIQLSSNFELTKSMFSQDIKLIDRKEFDITTTDEGQNERKALQEKCPCKYFISKPIFDKEFKTAVVSIGMNCGPLCGNGGYYIYKLINGVWESDDGFAFWIS